MIYAFRGDSIIQNRFQGPKMEMLVLVRKLLQDSEWEIIRGVALMVSGLRVAFGDTAYKMYK